MVMMVILGVVVMVVAVVMMRRELIAVTMMMLERLRLEVVNRLLMRLMVVVRGMTSRGVAPAATTGRGRGGASSRDRGVRVIRTGLGNRVVALHRRCTVVILQVGVIDVMMPVVFTLDVRRRIARDAGRLGSHHKRRRRHPARTRTSHRRVVG